MLGEMSYTCRDPILLILSSHTGDQLRSKSVFFDFSDSRVRLATKNLLEFLLPYIVHSSSYLAVTFEKFARTSVSVYGILLLQCQDSFLAFCWTEVAV